jgi:hypothetical protein
MPGHPCRGSVLAAILAAAPVAGCDAAGEADRDGTADSGEGNAGGAPVVVHDVPGRDARVARLSPRTPGLPAVPRLVAIGDLHSDIGATRAAFQLSGAIDGDGEWVGGDLTVVQLGDVIGRSDDEREVLDFILGIRAKAAARGGAVHVLVGNHEIMGGRVDFQAVGPNPFPAYVGMPGLDLEDPRLQGLPPEERWRGAALMTGGPYARRLAELPTVLKVGDTVYVHGGVVPRWAEHGIGRINQEVSAWLRGEAPEPEASRGVDDGDTVMWTRQFSRDVTDDDCAALDRSLAILGARRMIVAHTVQTTITPRCGDKVWAVDVGMSRAYGGPIEVLELVGDQDLTVLRR